MKSGLPFDLVTQSMLASDSPRHEILRKSVARYFTAGAAEGLEEQIAQVAARLAGDCVRKGHFDLVADFTAPSAWRY